MCVVDDIVLGSVAQEHRQESNPAPDSTPKKLLFWENRGGEVQRLEEELMTTRIREMETLTELKELRLRLMELETQVRDAAAKVVCVCD